MFIGNTYVYYVFKGQDEIEAKTRTVVVVTLTSIGACGMIVLLFLPKVIEREEEEDSKTKNEGPVQAFIESLKLFITPNMLLLSLIFFYTGLELGFFSGVYGSSIGFTETFQHRKELVGMNGIFIGVGQVLGGGITIILGSRTAKWGIGLIVKVAFIVHLTSFVLILINLPNSSPFSDTAERAYIASNPILAMFCSFLLGLGDTFYNTQLYTLIGSVYRKKSAHAFAVFKFTKCLGASASFIYAESLGLHLQLSILMVAATFGSICFMRVAYVTEKELRLLSSAKQKTEILVP